MWADAEDPPDEGSDRATVVVRDNENTILERADVPAAPVEVPLPRWRVGTDGILLRDTSADLGLPIQDTGPTMVTGVSSDRANAVRQAISRAGLDAATVQIYAPQPPPVPPAALLATAAAQVLLVLVATLAAVRGQTRVLRSYLGRLLAIGIPPAWARHVLFTQLGVLMAVSTVLGLVIAVVPHRGPRPADLWLRPEHPLGAAAHTACRRLSCRRPRRDPCPRQPPQPPRRPLVDLILRLGEWVAIQPVPCQPVRAGSGGCVRPGDRGGCSGFT